MKGCGNRQRLGHPGATRLAGFHGALDGILVPRNDRLTAGIEIDRLDNLALGGFDTGGSDACIIEAKDGGHRTRSDRNGLLHGGRA